MSWSTIDLAPLLPWSAIAVLAVLALAVVAVGAFGRARGILLRAAAAAMLLATLANPALIEEQREPLKDVAAIVVDESPSQSVGDRRAETERALAALEQQLGDRDDLELRVVRVREQGVASAADGTRLIGPLARALQDVPRRRIAGAILLTDGQVHDVPQEAAKAALPAPLHVLLSGRRDEADRRLVVVRAPTFGIVGKPVEMTLRVEDDAARGAAGRARVTIRQDGGEPREIRVPIGVDHDVSFNLEHGGQSVFEIAVSPGSRELTLENNRAVVAVSGVRDRLRVLLVSGEPHPGERTWRNLLKSDPSVDLVHFTILRPPEKQDGTPINELSLISFPTRELFEVKLSEFDLVIFDRYRRRGVLPPSYLQNVVDYVRNGGALMEAAGPTFASPFSLYRTPLGAALPGEPTGAVFERGFRPQLTEAGRRHPVTADLPGGPRPGDGPDGKQGEASWGRWFRQVEVDAKRGHALMDGIEGRPLLILDRFGEGRVAQLNSDHIWLWARGFEGGGPQAELLRRVAHWLMKEPELEENDLDATVQGDRLEIVRRSLEPDNRPVEVTAPDGSTQKVELADRHDGRYTAGLGIDQAGLYRVSDGERVAMAAAGPLNPIEFADVRATAARLAPAAEATGGSIKWIADGVPTVRQVRPGRRAAGENWIGLVANGDYVVTGVKRIPLMPALLVLLLALGATAWAWRREGR